MISYLYAALIAVGTLVIGILLGIWIRKRAAKRAEEKISNADEEALRIVNEAIKSAENKKREVMLEAKEDILRSRNEYEKEVKERRAEQQKQERRLQQKEENLDRKTDALEKREEALNQKHAALDKENEEIKIIKRSQTEMLERISGFTAEDAKKYLIEQVESEVTHETALKIKELEQRAKDEADSRAREIVASAIQRCAADHVAEITVSVVPLPNDEMKGRIIGREGRNIRTIETLTGVDLIIDDTPEAITVSCFEPVRREVARLALEKLIADGRIHPTHIEEMVNKARREVDAIIKSEGERAVLETGIRGLHPELVKMLGRLHYRTSYGQNVLQHSIEVSHLAGMMAADKVIAVSNLTRKIIIDRYGIPADKVVTVHNAVRFAERESVAPERGVDDKIVTFLGRITYQKGPDYFVEAAAKVLKRVPNVRFVMAGSGDMMNHVIRRVARLGIADRFHFTGFLKGEDVHRMFQLSDVYIMPSVSEPFGISPLEAMRSNVPVIISKQSGVAEVLDYAVKVDYWDVDAMADAIYGFIKYPALSKMFAKKGLEEVTGLKWNNAAAKIKSVYEDVINESRK